MRIEKLSITFPAGCLPKINGWAFPLKTFVGSTQVACLNNRSHCATPFDSHARGWMVTVKAEHAEECDQHRIEHHELGLIC